MSYVTIVILAFAVYGAMHSGKDFWTLLKAGYTKLKAKFYPAA